MVSVVSSHVNKRFVQKSFLFSYLFDRFAHFIRDFLKFRSDLRERFLDTFSILLSLLQVTSPFFSISPSVDLEFMSNSFDFHEPFFRIDLTLNYLVVKVFFISSWSYIASLDSSKIHKVIIIILWDLLIGKISNVLASI